jgi:hypothetical protein
MKRKKIIITLDKMDWKKNQNIVTSIFLKLDYIYLRWAKTIDEGGGLLLSMSSINLGLLKEYDESIKV